MMSETPARDLADPSAAAVAVPSHALNIKGRISKHPKTREKGNGNETGVTFIRPAIVSRFSQIPLYIFGTAAVTYADPQKGKGSFLSAVYWGGQCILDPFLSLQNSYIQACAEKGPVFY